MRIERQLLPLLRRKELARLTEQTNDQAVFADILDAIAAQGKPLLKGRSRQELSGRQTTICRPFEQDTKGQLKNILNVPFTIKDGITINWGKQVAAIAYGQVEGESNLILIGGIHYPETLAFNRIDPKLSYQFTPLIGEFPGHFQTDAVYLAFTIAPTSQKDMLGVVVGDHETVKRKLLLIEQKDLENPQTKRATLQQITTLIEAERYAKFRQ